MPTYLASDIHLRLDHRERAERFARWVDTLKADDPLFLVGDVCDFWYAARQRSADPLTCPGLRALADYSRRGGALTILPGNHDAWLGPLYRQALGARWVAEPLELTAQGQRLHLVHGHLLGGRAAWKGWMEGEAFLSRYEALPEPAARALQALLIAVNERRLEASHQRHFRVFRQYVDALPNPPDLVVCGHVHATLDETRPGGTRLVVLGDWYKQSSYLRVDDQGAKLIIEPL